MFTNTPDEHFIIDHHPQHKQVVLASPCSGHGYKFCSVVGEILSDLATGDGSTKHKIDFLRLTRPALFQEPQA
jgi:sarcosine oxidase